MIRATLIAAVLLAGPVHAAPSTWLQRQTENMHQVVGPFVNTSYGFSIEPPPGAIEYVSNGGDADNGPILIRGEGRDIVVYAAYTGFVPGDATPCGPQQSLLGSVSAAIAETGQLDRHRACMVTFRHRNVISRLMQTIGNDHGAGILYTLLLTTTPRWSRADFLSFRRVGDSFRRVRIFP